MSEPLCSVVIPSYNRRASLEMVLEGLARQTLSADRFEVLVILDGSTDDSAEMLAAWQRSGRIKNLRWHRQENSGQATARNTGAKMAASQVVLFIDDDIVPEPELVAVHVRHHAGGRSIAVLGDCEIVCKRDDTFYQRFAWSWWEDLYHQRALPGRKPGYRDFCAGNVSLRRDDFLRVGGFDTEFRGYGGEDYELGYRLLRAGMEFVSDRSARAMHHHPTRLPGLYRNSRQEAHGDVLLARKHPELMTGLRFMYTPGGIYKLLALLGMSGASAADVLPRIFLALLVLFERVGVYSRWLGVMYYLRGYGYWRGLHDIFPSWAELKAFRAGAPPIPEMQLDITDGLPESFPGLWVDGPSRIHVSYRGRRLGTLAIHQPIMEPVRPYLATLLTNQLAEPIRLATLTNPPAGDEPMPDLAVGVGAGKG